MKLGDQIASVAEPAAHPIKAQPDLGILQSRYRITQKLGAGGMAEVYEIVDLNHRRLAMKVKKLDKKCPTMLSKEFDIYRILLLNSPSTFRTPGIPFVYEYKEHNGLEYLFMERLGESLLRIMFSNPEKQLYKKDVLMIGIQVVRTLQHLHENGILHCDIKPENLVMGTGPNAESTVHLIDFGFAIVVEDWKTYDYAKFSCFGFTEFYAPAEALLKLAPSRKGDLEGLVYTLLCLAFGGLPWKCDDARSGRQLHRYEKALQRAQYQPQALCLHFPELEKFVDIIYRMERWEEPDYEGLLAALKEGLEKQECTDDGSFEWLNSEAENPSEALCNDTIYG